MLSEFLVYLRLGFEHITDPGGLDHLLFVAVLTASDVDRPKHLVWLVTAFTLGHSITLAAGFGLIHGLGFSSFLRAALGGEQSLLLPLFSFNVGLERM